MTDLSPGVYREERFSAPPQLLPTGVPGFVGFGVAHDDAPLLIQHPRELADRFTADPSVDGYLIAAVSGFFANGGQRCYVVGAGGEGDRAATLIAAIPRLAPLADLDLVAIPDAMALVDADARLRVQGALVSHCQQEGNRFAILDGPSMAHLAERWTLDHPGTSRPDEGDLLETLVKTCQTLTMATPENAALYFPWVKVPGGAGSPPVPVPPCGHVAGIYARSDARVGVHKAPANEKVEGILDLEVGIDANRQAQLNPIGINCLRAFPGRGLRLYGARTLSSDPTWRYVNARRTILTLARWIDRNLTWAAFEPNGPGVWLRIQRELNARLNQLWQVGALQGASPEQAYFVKCDGEINPPEAREQGTVVTEIGLAPSVPAEFIVVRIIHSAFGIQFEGGAAGR